MASCSNSLTVNCSRDVKLVADVILSEYNHAKDHDMLIIPGGLGGTNFMCAQKHVLDIVKFYESRLIASICAGPLVLKEAKVHKGKKISCHPSVKSKLCEMFEVVDKKSTYDSNLVTGAGPGAAIDFAFECVRRLCSEGMVEEVKAPMCL